MLALQALATACVSCGPDQPASTKEATARLREQLVLLVNPENALQHLGAAGPVSNDSQACCALPSARKRCCQGASQRLYLTSCVLT